jgi:hypothetical protein
MEFFSITYPSSLIKCLICTVTSIIPAYYGSPIKTCIYVMCSVLPRVMVDFIKRHQIRFLYDVYDSCVAY